MKVAVINGPNINMLGKREASHYGAFTLSDLEMAIEKRAKELSLEAVFFQSNSEGELVTYIQRLECDAIIINAAAYTHTSVAIRDALLAVKKPFIEVHISNVFAREDFRHRSYLSDIASGVIVGLGMNSYLLALEYFGGKND